MFIIVISLAYLFYFHFKVILQYEVVIVALYLSHQSILQAYLLNYTYHQVYFPSLTLYQHLPHDKSTFFFYFYLDEFNQCPLLVSQHNQIIYICL